MRKLLERLRRLFYSGDMSDARLGGLVATMDWSGVDLSLYYPSEDPVNYKKNVIQLEPVEVSVIRWSENVSSAIHEHDGFYGYVVVLEGEIQNTEYQLSNGKMKVLTDQVYKKGAIISTPDETIHKMGNIGLDTAITLHIYYPSQPSLNNTRIFDESGKIGVLNENAKVASFDQDEENFHDIQENSFEFSS